MTLQRLLMLAISLTPLILAGFVWNLSIDSSSILTSNAPAAGDLPESQLSDLTFNQFDITGNLVQQLETTRAINHVAGQEVELLEPRLLITGGDQTRWSASSQWGFLDRPGSQLQLNGDVVLRRLGALPAELLTDSLTWLPASASAYTDDLVVIDAPGRHMQSQGISIDLEQSNFVFHSSVRGTHEPL